ncbi:hypothetical protein RBG61_00480 [Paludicola sp. MB14-C6]|uniref:hypothetical protein n=1 Tax=Paludihabitans sp. MB14-C6 TaxID=3070656 RepID=UPI0027DE4669|nr:hypothetical protein [Paludicola sp. MB14-C6]WMJ23166.1 hypothetical protein RBG61_00480 [Paludicola sp. MB14-C6]
MLFANQNDIIRCSEIVRKELTKNNIAVNDNVVNKIAIDVMDISYSKGGDYSDSVIQSFAETYIEEGFYKKFIE